MGRLIKGVSDVDGSEFAVLMALAYFADDDGGSCYPSVATIAAAAHIKSVRTVQLALRRLAEKGYVAVTQEGGGRYRSNHFRLLIPDLQSLETPQNMQGIGGETPQNMHPLEKETPQSTTQTPQILHKTPQISTSNPAKYAPNQLVNNQRPDKDQLGVSNQKSEIYLIPLAELIQGKSAILARHERMMHHRAIEIALRAGKYVPPRVLADYPDLTPVEARVAR
jgi:hypothetical protein